MAEKEQLDASMRIEQQSKSLSCQKGHALLPGPNSVECALVGQLNRGALDLQPPQQKSNRTRRQQQSRRFRNSCDV